MSKIDNFPYPTPIPVKIWDGALVMSTDMLRRLRNRRFIIIIIVPFGVDP